MIYVHRWVAIPETGPPERPTSLVSREHRRCGGVKGALGQSGSFNRSADLNLRTVEDWYLDIRRSLRVSTVAVDVLRSTELLSAWLSNQYTRKAPRWGALRHKRQNESREVQLERRRSELRVGYKYAQFCLRTEPGPPKIGGGGGSIGLAGP